MATITLRTETGQFLAQFSKNVQRLFLSNLFQAASNPLAAIFIGAFIWRATGSLIAVAAFPLGQFALQPFIFFLNGVVLRRWHIRRAFFFGALGAGVGSVAVAFFAFSPSPLLFFTGGFLKAVGHGFYYPNRNYLELQETTDGARNYFYGLLHAVKQVANIAIPFIAGWFIVLGTHSGWYTSVHAYWSIFGLSFLLMLGAGVVILRGTYESPAPAEITRFHFQQLWNERHLLNLAQGFVDGLYFIPSLAVLVFLGNEGVLGTATAVAGLIAALLMYLYGRFADGHGRHHACLLSSAVFVLCSLALIVLPQPLNALVYVLLAASASDFFEMACSPLLMAFTDREMGSDERLRYSLVFDNEFFLNLGRVCSIMLVICIALIFSQEAGLLYGSLAGGLVQLSLIGALFVYRKMPAGSTLVYARP